MIAAVVFDWGDTVMRDFRANEGPMASWPRVEAVAGAEQALRALHPRYRLALATNASDSNEELVRRALHRVGLESFFERVFVSSDLGVEKPDARFFAAVLLGLQLPARQVVMVGDSYGNDVRGAKGAGLRTVWFNPADRPAPNRAAARDLAVLDAAAHHAAAHDAEISDLSQLEAALAGLELRVSRSDAVARD